VVRNIGILSALIRASGPCWKKPRRGQLHSEPVASGEGWLANVGTVSNRLENYLEARIQSPPACVNISEAAENTQSR
jgi:hypothetical protein